MANFSAKIFSSALSSLRSQMAKIAVVSNNVANADTPGYARRTVNLSTVKTSDNSFLGQVGDGVKIENIVRNTNVFFINSLLAEESQVGFYGSQSILCMELDKLYGSAGVGRQISTRLAEFFSSLQEISVNPSSIPLRLSFIEKAKLLTDSIRLTYKSIAMLQRKADRMLSEKVDKVNEIISQVSDLNIQIKSFEAQNGHETALDLRDQRDKLLKDLAKLIDFSVIENIDGTLSVSLRNGITLVNGSHVSTLRTTNSPTFTTNTTYGLDGEALSYVVVELGPNSQIDVSDTIKNSGGELGGLLSFRGLADPSISNPFDVQGSVVSIARQIEALSRFFVTTINQYYRGYDPNLPANGDEDPSTPTFFDPSAVDLNGNTPGVYGLFGLSGVSLTDTNSDGLANDLASLTVFSVAERLTMLVDDPNQLAFSRDLDPLPGSILGSPGDGRIAQRISEVQYQNVSFTSPGFTFFGKPKDLSHLTETQVGVLVRDVKERLSVHEARSEFYATKLEEIQGVNTDEELAYLIQFQRNYQYSARLLGIADNLLAEILNII
ncbi:MAG: flagellar hook-associated protein FlgK [Deltaproteobacteria bacterium]|nr:flagellar hook-associated protein FlgK [Deltaproteobacteria bacterium]